MKSKRILALMMSMAMASSIAMPVAAETPEGEQTVVDIENISVDESEDVLEDSDEESGVVENFANNVETVDEKEAVEPQIENQANTGDEVQVLDSTDSAAEDSKCGENATWTLQDGVLHISGTGAMDDYQYEYEGDANTPWYSRKDEINTIVIDDGITYIGASAFYHLENVVSVSIPESVTVLGDGAFYECTGLVKVTLPRAMKTIGEGAFYSCTSLIEINMPESLSELSGSAFYNCTSLKEISIPQGITGIEMATFAECTSLETVILPEGINKIGWQAFLNCINLSKIVLPETIKTIENSAFTNCESLTEINIPESVTTIQDYAFAGCTSLKSVVIPNSITSLPYKIFSGCSSLEKVTLPEGLITIYPSAFSECSSLTGIILPGSVKEIWWESFKNCTSLKKITIPDGVAYIANNLFNGCTSLTEVNLPVTINSIQNCAFDNCTNLKRINYAGTEENWSEISIDSDNEGLSNVTICYENTGNSCGENATWTLQDGVLHISGTGAMDDYDYDNTKAPWYGVKDQITSIIIDNGITSIGDFTFTELINLASVEIPDSVTDIEIRAFDGCTNLKKLILPKTLKIVGDGAFNNCTNLEDVYYAGAESDRVNLNIAQGNDLLINATWHYETTSDKPEDKPEVKDSEEAFVDRLYQNILGRDSDPAGAKAWTEELQSGEKTGVEVAQGFFESDEMKKREFTDEEYINALYLTFLNREADASGMAAWKAVLDSGLSRMHVFKGFAESQEFTVICDNYGIERGNADLTAPRDQNEGVTKFIARNYKMCLGRSADEDGINAWCNQILTGQNTAKEVAYGFVFSQEFKEKNLSDADFVKLLYNVFMNREADEAGFNAWMKVLKDGQSREHVFNGFADSVEFRDVCTGYGIQ